MTIEQINEGIAACEMARLRVLEELYHYRALFLPPQSSDPQECARVNTLIARLEALDGQESE